MEMIVNGSINNQVIELLPDENDFPLENRISTLVPAITLPSVEELETKIDSLKSKINDVKLVYVSAPVNLFKEEKVKQQKAINLLEKKLRKWEKNLAALQFPVEPSVADLEPIRVEKAFLSLREESEGWAKTLLKVFEYSFYPLETIILKPYFLIFFPLFARTAAVILSLREKIKSNIENDSQLILEFFSSGFLILQAISVMSLIGLIIARRAGRVHLIEEALQLERFASVEDQTPSLQAHEESVSLLGWLVRELEYKIFSTVEARPVDHSLPVIERLSKDPSLRYEIQPQSEEELYFF